MSISANRVTLRPLCSNDAQAFLKWAGDSAVTASLFWDPHRDIENAQKFLKTVVEPHRWFMAICLDGFPVGAITLDVGGGRAVKRAELGYVLAKEYWGKGIATEAVQQALIRGFKELDIVRIEAFVDPENKSSLRVLEKSGMIKEAHLAQYVVHRGQVRDRFIFAKIIS